MGSTFNPQILVEKLAKLNSSQTSIETLSHWCIFHMNKAKQVVETWDRQFHCSPKEQRVAFLYLANDILQNSRRKGSDFVGEFWKVLPEALRDVIENGDDFGKTAALRLINIWEERKVFGSRGQILKEEFGGRHVENRDRNGKDLGHKLKQPVGNILEKIVSVYQHLNSGQVDEEVVLSKCRNAISCFEKVEKEIGNDSSSGGSHDTAIVEEVQGQYTVFRNCIDQLTTVESSRARLVSHLREALQEQEIKLDRVRNELQAAQSKSEQVNTICRQLLGSNASQLLANQSLKEDIQMSIAPQTYVPADREHSVPVMYSQRAPSYPEQSGHTEEDPRKSAAAAVAAKLTASTSSAEMLSMVLSSLASEGVIGNPVKDSSGDYASEKRPRLENNQTPYIPSQNPEQPSIRPFPHPESLQHDGTTSVQQHPLPPSSSPPLPPPLPPMVSYPAPPQFMQAAGPMNTGMPFNYSMSQQPHSLPGYQVVGTSVTGGLPSFPTPPASSYQGFPGSEGGFYNQPTSLPTAPMSRQ
ncbi:hypothetical protein J3R85_020572 [Psidium guajava]|nr:hypothetical protein J3R85_020572 [Psidium guajava]